MTDVRDADATAAELALGVLDGDERAGALRRMLAEPGFAAEVAWWRDALGPLFDEVPAVAAPTDGFAHVERLLDGAEAPVVRRGWLWPSLAGAGGLAAAASLALLLTQPTPTPQIVTAPPTALRAGVIAPTGAGEPVSAVYDEATGTLLVGGGRFADAAQSAELWVIGTDAVPHSLGLLRAGGTTRVIVTTADRGRLAADVVLAVSVEPEGGSPTGKPTGPVVAKGTLSTT